MQKVVQNDSLGSSWVVTKIKTLFRNLKLEIKNLYKIHTNWDNPYIINKMKKTPNKSKEPLIIAIVSLILLSGILAFTPREKTKENSLYTFQPQRSIFFHFLRDNGRSYAFTFLERECGFLTTTIFKIAGLIYHHMLLDMTFEFLGNVLWKLNVVSYRPLFVVFIV